ncbi:MAG TPA: rhodanese-related sulfurtransferase [Candidatus Saccharimonadales bacterium]|nr:rhodanese-related sulfurtransferase [Candidatus Saccharimonadales bacterium]
MQKIILYYKFVPLADPDMTRRWQNELCTRLNLRGRIIISRHGINGTVGGNMADVKTYVREMNKTPEFKGIEYKWSDGMREDFPKLSVKVRDELVTLEPGENFDVFDKGTPLRPKAWHEYIQKHPDAIIFDARNDYESEIGEFRNAIKPKMKTFKQVKEHVEKLPKDKPVLTYCTGDIRCEYLSAYMKHKGFKDVYHLDGGIVKYGEEFGDEGYWDGKCYVFDKRMKLAFSDKSKDIGVCAHCGAATSEQVNCAKLSCNLQFVVCESCQTKEQTSCERHAVSA